LKNLEKLEAVLAGRTCIFEGCQKPLSAKGYCSMHYARLVRHGDPTKGGWPSLDEKFEKYVVRSAGCWSWRGSKQGAGYGYIFRNKRHPTTLIHRYSWEKHTGNKIPAGYDIDHLCRNRLCCNPEHLEPVPPIVNILRGTGHSAMNAKKTKCINGHDLPVRNNLAQRQSRICKLCGPIYAKRAYERLKKKNKINIPSPRWNPQRALEMDSMRRTGMRNIEIARALGISGSAVYAMFVRLKRFKALTALDAAIAKEIK